MDNKRVRWHRDYWLKRMKMAQGWADSLRGQLETAERDLAEAVAAWEECEARRCSPRRRNDQNQSVAQLALRAFPGRSIPVLEATHSLELGPQARMGPVSIRRSRSDAKKVQGFMIVRAVSIRIYPGTGRQLRVRWKRYDLVRDRSAEMTADFDDSLVSYYAPVIERLLTRKVTAFGLIGQESIYANR
jgi:hypothetical protein